MGNIIKMYGIDSFQKLLNNEQCKIVKWQAVWDHKENCISFAVEFEDKVYSKYGTNSVQ